MRKISVVIPVYNEEGNISEIYSRIKKLKDLNRYDYEIIFVDDGSVDNTPLIIKEIGQIDKKVKLVSFSRNFGHQVAISAGLRFASGDAIITLDADLQHPPELIPLMIGEWEKGYKIVYTIREVGEVGFFKKTLSKLFYSLINLFSDIKIPFYSADFRLLDRNIVEVLRDIPEYHKFIRGLVSWVGFEKKALCYRAEKRYAGKSKYNLGKMVKMAIDGITSFSIRPLKLATYLGFITATTAFLYAVYALYSKFFTDKTLPGWTSILLAVLFLGGIQLIALGILGEYIGRTYEQVKGRPLYIIKETFGFE